MQQGMQLREQLSGTVPDSILYHLSNRFDVIGDIAVLHLRQELWDYRHAIASAIISSRRTIKTVINKTTKLTGENRTAHYEILAGTKTETLHREFGFSYRLDVRTVFFNPRLATERKRVTDQVQSDETVLIPFCGAGPFVVPAAARGADVVAVEQNPEACRWFMENCTLNCISDRITLVEGDVFDTTLIPNITFDRAIIPTPYGMDTILDVIVPLVRKGGVIHFYTFRNRLQIEGLVSDFEGKGLNVVRYRRCGHVAPSVSRWVFNCRKISRNIRFKSA